MSQFKLGSISTGTLKTDDLLGAFAEALSNHGGDNEHHELIADAFMAQCEFGHEDAEILEELEFQLREICPPFVYFGSHPDDSADFGFWPDMRDLNEAIRLAGNYQGKDASEGLWLSDDRVIVQVSDHGNVEVMDLDRNILWSTS